MDHLLTEARNARTESIDVMTSIEVVELMCREDALIPAAVAVEAERIAQVVELVAAQIRVGGRLVYIGAGTSGRLGVLDASECPPTFNSPPGQIVGLIAGGERALTTAIEGAEDRPELALADLQRIELSSRDVLVGIASSGRTPYVIAGLKYAREQGARAIGLVCVPDSEIAQVAEITIAPIVGPEVLTGSTRLKAGTATKLVLNMITTGAMIRLGKAYGNLMVDLRATNVKLRARTNRIVRQLLGIDHDAAEQLLLSCQGEVKTAIVVGKTGCTPEEARQQLDSVGGRIGELLRQRLFAVDHDLFMGVDGGGTSTTAVLGVLDQGRIREIGRGVSGPSNAKAIGFSSACAAIDLAISRAFSKAGRERLTVESICLGLAGAGRPEDQEAIRRWVDRQRIANRPNVIGDVELPLAMLPQGQGIAIVAGTGSCVFARSTDGRIVRGGGWGPILGDCGSAQAIGLDAIRHAITVLDQRRSATPLSTAIATRMKVTAPSEMIQAINGQWDRARVAELAESVLGLAERGDVDAGSIVRSQLAAFATTIVAVLDQLQRPTERVPTAITGGLLIQSHYYREQLLTQLGVWRERLDVALVADPAEAALRLAAS